LVDHAKAGLRVVRLKSGDSGMFGRLEEEIIALQDVGIPFEIIPGVTSASAAAATAGIPLTRRLTARRVQFITGADVTGDLPPDVNMAALADPMATTVVYMGKRTFPGLVRKLIEHGLPSSTPAMLAEAVSTPAEKVTRHTIATLAAHLESTTSTTPALIFYGPLAELEG
jgi:uroporphyrin-III C-methyltransferase